MTTWSYSSIKTFEQCPKKYYHLKVAKDVKDVPGPAADYGTAVHKSAEDYIRDGAPLPPEHKFMEPVVSALNDMPGQKYTEIRMGLRLGDEGYEKCEFFAPDVWWRGVADFVCIDGHRAKSLDYKTGKSARYADLRQMDLVAGSLFVHFPQLLVIDSALAFVATGDFIKKRHTADKKETYLKTFDPLLDQLATAEETGVWNAKSSGLCGWCPVTQCPHHRPRR